MKSASSRAYAKDSGIEILVAEDSATQAERVRYLLSEHGYAVTMSADGRRALDAARERKPALIISDVMMPEMNGFELCAEIKRDPQLHDVPVILLTSLSDVLDIMQGLKCGADNFIRKPYEDSYLLTRVDYLLMTKVLRRSQKMQMGVEIYLGGEKHFITSERQQIVDLLISVYEEAVHLSSTLKKRERELSESNETLTGLYRVAEGLNGATSEHEVCRQALENAMHLPGVEAGWIFLLNGDESFRLGGAQNLPPTLKATCAVHGLCECQREFFAGRQDRAMNMPACKRLEQAGDGTRSHTYVPLGSGNESLGILNLVSVEGAFEEDELETLNGVGHQVAVALERAHLHEHLERLVDERTAALTRLNRLYAVLSGINTTIVRVHERQHLFDEACRIAVELGKFAFAWIGLFDAQSHMVTPVAWRGRDDALRFALNLKEAADASVEDTPTVRTLLLGQPVICNSVSADGRLQPLGVEIWGRDYRSLALFPLVMQGQLAGVLALYASEENVFDADEKRLLVEIAGDISFAMTHLKNEDRLNYLAFYNEVTGLPNRMLFIDRVGQRLNLARRGNKVFSLIMFDLVHFSRINESLGRQAGDNLLRELTRRVQEVLSEADILAHFSADQFCIATHFDDEGATIVQMLEDVLSAIWRRPFLAAGQELSVSARAGVVSYPGDGKDIEALLDNAESALKNARISGEKYLFYTPSLNVMVAERLSLENRLRHALERDELVLHYQPKIDITTGRISGVEALLRWNDPKVGLVPPMQFIPLMEETGLILEVGKWALEKAVSDALAWHAKGFGPVRVSVNVSPVQLRQRDFVGMIEHVVKDDGDVAYALELEITESLVMRDIMSDIRKLQMIRQMGVEVAIDDFGTGYSSLSYIARLPASTLKIDRAFVMDMANSSDDQNIVSTIVSLAHSLDMRVVAEGVETDAQARLLRLLKCDEIQGFLFSPAVPADQMEKLFYEDKTLLLGHMIQVPGQPRRLM